MSIVEFNTPKLYLVLLIT